GGFAVALAQVAQLQPRRDLRQHIVVDELDAQHDRSVVREIVGSGDGHRGKDRGLPQKGLQADGATRRGTSRRGGGIADGGTAAHLIENAFHVRLDRVEPIRIDAAAAESGVEEMVGSVGDEDEIVLEVRLQPGGDVALYPLAIEPDSNPANGASRRGDTLDLAQYALAARGERAAEQLSLAVERDLVRAPRRAEHRDHDADDGDGHDHADRN